MDTALKTERPNSLRLIFKTSLVRPEENHNIARGGIKPKKFLNTEICKILYLLAKSLIIKLIKSKDNIPIRIITIAFVKLDNATVSLLDFLRPVA